MSDPDLEKSTLKLVVDHARIHYEDLANTWRDIERKAQANVAIAGVFLTAASVMYLSIKAPPIWLSVVFFFAVLCLAVSAGFSVGVLFVAETEAIPSASKFRSAVVDALDRGSASDEHSIYQTILVDHISKWEKTSSSLWTENNRKAERLHCAQSFLLASIVVVLAVMFLAVFLPTSHVNG